MGEEDEEETADVFTDGEFAEEECQQEVVAAIKDRRKSRKKATKGLYEYLVAWEGYTDKEDSWEPIGNLEQAHLWPQP